MADDAFFLKKKTRPRALAGKPGEARTARPRPARPARPPPPPLKGKGKAVASPAVSSAAPSPAAEPEVNPENLLEFQIISAPPDSGLRYNVMRFNTQHKDFSPVQIPAPILMNRKQPGPRQPPQFAVNEEGKIVGRYVYDEEGKPVLDDEGKPVVEKRNEMDMSLVGTAPGQANKRRGKRKTKEVFHQDVEVIKLRREEANPWILEAQNPTEAAAVPTGGRVPQYWVGRMQEQSALPTVLLVNEGDSASFTMVPLGRTYRFEPQRPFKVMDAETANKYFELQAKSKIHDRWGQRQEDNGAGPSGVKSEVKLEVSGMSRLEERARRMEMGIILNKNDGEIPQARPRARVKREDWRDAEMDLDYDVNEEFQDDDENNTFYANEGQGEEDAQIRDQRQRQELRWANANVGDRPHVDESDDDDDDLFGDKRDKLDSEGKRLRKLMRKHGREDEQDLYASTDDSDDDSDSDSDDEEAAKEKAKEKEKEKEKASRNDSRAGSRERSVGSPGRRLPPTPERAGTAPPGAGAALLAKRAASRGGSPRRSRAGSPLARGNSPDVGRSGSPANGRAASPTIGRGSSPSAPPVREGTPSGPKPKSKSAKRKATSESPLREVVGAGPSGSGNKRKSPDDTPTPSSGVSSPAADGEGGQKKKKKKSRGSSSTPVPMDESFPSMITRDQVLQWLREQRTPEIPMRKAIGEFARQITDAGDNKDRNQQLFLHWIRTFTDKGDKQALRLKPEYLA